MVIIMLGIDYGISNHRLYVSTYEDKVDEGLDIHSKRAAMERAEAARKEALQKRTKEVAEFGSTYGFEITEDLMDKALSRYNIGGYSNIVAKAMKDITSYVKTAKALERFVLDKSKNQIGDGWQCLCKEQNLARDLLCCMAYKDYAVAH